MSQLSPHSHKKHQCHLEAWGWWGSIFHAQSVQNRERNSSQTSDQFHGGFSPKTTYVWGMLSEAAGSSSAGLSLLISLSFIRQREIQNRRSEEVEEEGGKKSQIFYSHTLLCSSGLMMGLKEPDEFKASEEKRGERKSDQSRDTIRDCHKSRVLMAEEHALKRPSGFSKPNIYFEQPPQRVSF